MSSVSQRRLPARSSIIHGTLENIETPLPPKLALPPVTHFIYFRGAALGGIIISLIFICAFKLPPCCRKKNSCHEPHSAGHGSEFNVTVSPISVISPRTVVFVIASRHGRLFIKASCNEPHTGRAINRPCTQRY